MFRRRFGVPDKPQKRPELRPNPKVKLPPQNVIEPLQGLELDDPVAEEAMKLCICPKKGCKVHPAV